MDVAKTGGEEKGTAIGEQHGRIARQDKHRGASKHQEKQRGKELHPKQSTASSTHGTMESDPRRASCVRASVSDAEARWSCAGSARS